jgi:heme exporter protein CcmD
MTYAGYVVAGYGITAGAIGVYTWRVLSRARALRRSLPPEEQHW